LRDLPPCSLNLILRGQKWADADSGVEARAQEPGMFHTHSDRLEAEVSRRSRWMYTMDVGPIIVALTIALILYTARLFGG
jgi:hypothetical protein